MECVYVLCECVMSEQKKNTLTKCMKYGIEIADPILKCYRIFFISVVNFVWLNSIQFS